MGKIILFLDSHSGSMTFIITAVYVITTIIICWTNINATNVAKKQLSEMQKQFCIINRPNISMELILEKRIFYGLKFTNMGGQTAFDVNIKLSDEFINSLPEKNFQDLLNKNQGKKCTIGVGKHYDLYIGTCDAIRQTKINDIKVQITYRGIKGSDYSEDFEIDIQNHSIFFSVDSERDDILKALKNQNKELQNINETLKIKTQK